MISINDELDLFPDIKDWDKKTGNHAYVPPVVKESLPTEENETVIYCLSCGVALTDTKNRAYHLMHEIKIYKHHPKDIRFKIEEII